MPTQTSEAPAILRGMLRDIIACDDYYTVCRLMGMVPAGPDVDEIEHYKSHERLERFDPVAEDAFTHADIAAELLYRLTHLGCDGEDDEDENRERAMFTLVSRTAASTVIGYLLEKGILGVLR